MEMMQLTWFVLYVVRDGRENESHVFFQSSQQHKEVIIILVSANFSSDMILRKSTVRMQIESADSGLKFQKFRYFKKSCLMNMRYIILELWIYLQLVMQNKHESLWYTQTDLSNSQKFTVKAIYYSLIFYNQSHNNNKTLKVYLKRLFLL